MRAEGGRRDGRIPIPFSTFRVFGRPVFAVEEGYANEPEIDRRKETSWEIAVYHHSEEEP